MFDVLGVKIVKDDENKERYKCYFHKLFNESEKII